MKKNIMRIVVGGLLVLMMLGITACGSVVTIVERRTIGNAYDEGEDKIESVYLYDSEGNCYKKVDDPFSPFNN